MLKPLHDQEIILNLFNLETTDDLPKLLKRPHRKLSNLAMHRSSDQTLVGHNLFANDELDTVLLTRQDLLVYTFNTAKFMLITTPDFETFAVSFTNAKTLTDAVRVYYNPGKDAVMQEKVVGTSFKFQADQKVFDDFAGSVTKNGDDLPIKHGLAVLWPDPDNRFDPTAVKVIAKLADGKSFDLGYLPKNSPAKALVKKPMQVKLLVLGYSFVGAYADSFLVEF